MFDAATSSPRQRRVAVVGGGWAGCAAAATLTSAGVPVTLFEQATTLGGRARRVVHEGVALDNGQHLLIGAYRQTLELVARVRGAGSAPELFHRLPLTLRSFGDSEAIRFGAWRAPAPLHLAGGLLSARGLSLGERLALFADIRRLRHTGFVRPDSETVSQCFAGSRQRVFVAIWKPLCLAALNTPPEYASARIFAQVLRAAFTGSASNSDFLLPIGDLSTSFPDAAARFIEQRGGIIRKGISVRAIARRGADVALSWSTGSETFTGAIVAVGPHQLRASIGPDAATDDAWRGSLAQVAAFAYESITTIYCAFAAPIPFAARMLRLDDKPGQWIFDRGAVLAIDRGAVLASDATRKEANLYAVVISGSGPHDALEHTTLAAQVEAQLRRLAPNLPALVWSRVFAEKRATYACVPGMTRPACGRVAPGIFLAGDYTDPEFPATLEAATRSGVNAAHALIAEYGGAPCPIANIA